MVETHEIMQFDWDAIGKKPSVHRLYISHKGCRGRSWMIVKMLEDRELYGRQQKLSILRCRVAIDTLVHPKINLQGDVEPYMKHALLMGLSSDSSYVLCMVVSDFCALDKFLVVAQLRPTALIPLYTIRVKQRRAIDYFYASFSRNSSIISVIAAPKIPKNSKIEPYFFDAYIHLVNLKHCLLISMTATIRVSCRWSTCKLDRVFLRSTDYGAILNNGLSIVALIFLPSLTEVVDAFKTKIFRLTKWFDGSYENSDENLKSSVVIDEVRRLRSSLYPADHDDVYSLERLGVASETLDLADNGKMYFAISVTEVLPFIKTGINKLVHHFSFKVSEIKCVDYELDIVECTPDFLVYSVVSTLIKIKTAEEQSSTYVAVFSINTNVLTRTSDVFIWKKLRAVNVREVQFSSRRDQWYPFSEKCNKSIEERLVSDECLYLGKSASVLWSSFPGMELEKGVLL